MPFQLQKTWQMPTKNWGRRSRETLHCVCISCSFYLWCLLLLYFWTGIMSDLSLWNIVDHIHSQIVLVIFNKKSRPYYLYGKYISSSYSHFVIISLRVFPSHLQRLCQFFTKFYISDLRVSLWDITTKQYDLRFVHSLQSCEHINAFLSTSPLIFLPLCHTRLDTTVRFVAEWGHFGQVLLESGSRQNGKILS